MDEEELIREISELRELLKKKEDNLAKLRRERQVVQKNGLNNEEIARYGRQILMPEIGVKGQVRIKESSVLIVGAGGLGCPSSLYLAGAGVGHIGIIDYDVVEINNLHRQLLFTESDLGKSKVDAAAHHITRLNANVKVTPYKIQLDSSNALDIIEQYDVILDCTDNVPTRYLLNDACVLAEKPLVSGSALKMEGQLTVYNYNKGPCYRCIFPLPPPPETVTSCGDGGVLGAAVGTIGVLQALEALKVILEKQDVLSRRLFLFNGLDGVYKAIRLRDKSSTCSVCGSNPKITKLIDYEQFCGSKANDKDTNLNLLGENDRITVEEYRDLRNDKPHVLLDVRSPEEFEICHLKGATNIPYINFIHKRMSDKPINKMIKRNFNEMPNFNLYVICRRGNDSQKAVEILRNSFDVESKRIKDIVGGIHAWTRKIDPTFPIY